MKQPAQWASCLPLACLLFLGCGKDTDVKWRTLYTAVQKGDVEDVQRHLNRGLDELNEVNDTYGWTPLHRATTNGHTEIVELLLEHGARTDIKDTFGKTPLDYAQEEGFEDIAGAIEDSSEAAG